MIFAVHISDGVLRPEGLYPITCLAAVLVLIATAPVKEAMIPRLSLFAAALFVASQIHVKIGAGVSVHLLLNAMTGIVLGRLCVIPIAVAIALQAVLFAHGGLWTIGVNTLTMALPALVGGWLFRTALPRWNKPFTLGAIMGALVSTSTVLLTTIIVYTLGVDSEWVAGTVLLAHIPVIVLETILTGTLVSYFVRVRPEWFRSVSLRSEPLPTVRSPR